MTNIKRCFVCSKSRKHGVVLHRFPKTPAVYEAWKNYCRMFLPSIREEDNFKSNFLCNKHFSCENYKSGSKLLKEGAVPSIISEQDVPIGDIGFHTSTIGLDTSIMKMVAIEINEGTSTLTMSQPVDQPSCSNGSLAFSEENVSCPVEGIKQEVLEEDMVCSKTSKNYLCATKKEFMKRSSKIKLLQQHCRRLEEKVKNLKDLLEQLSRENDISEEAIDVLLGQQL